MKKYFFCFCVLLSVSFQAQIQQNIDKFSAVTIHNFTAAIDSIRFSSNGNEMQVEFLNGASIVHSLPTIQSVYFSEPTSAEHTCEEYAFHNDTLSYGTMTDQQGNAYKTIIIGTQEWMAENLRTGIYRNGDPIPNIIDGNQWINLTFGAWSYYFGDLNYDCPYGKWYNWFAVADQRNLCPAGWHIPSLAEWNILISTLDPAAVPGSPNIAGGKLKTTGTLSNNTGLWEFNNVGATNESGFSAIPSGLRSSFDAASDLMGLGSLFWTSSPSDESFLAWNFSLGTSGVNASFLENFKQDGFSVRCLKD
jgi:uncharacterized protein (TIGR02145 family)